MALTNEQVDKWVELIFKREKKKYRVSVTPEILKKYRENYTEQQILDLIAADEAEVLAQKIALRDKLNQEIEGQI